MAVKHLYFAYGSNMDREDWTRWCEKRGLDPSGLVRIGQAWLPDYILKFHYYSSSRKGGAADVVPSVRGTAVPGLLFEVDGDMLATLDIKEGAPHVYEQTPVQIIDGDGMLKEAITYTVSASRISDTYVEPTHEYTELIRRSLISNNLPIEHLKNAIENNTSKPFLETVFVYGTLREGELRFQTMNELSTKREIGTVRATLYDHGAYPGLSPEGTTEVVGEVSHCADISHALKILDQIEGFYSYGQQDNLYYRSIIKVLLNGEARWAWTYITNIPSDRTIIASGDWKNR